MTEKAVPTHLTTPNITPAPSPHLQRQCGCEQCATCHDSATAKVVPPVLHEALNRPIPTIQPKLKIGAPNDKYEQEADRVADQVMDMPEPTVQRQLDMPEKDDETLKRKEIAPQISPLIQRQAGSDDEEEDLLQTKRSTNSSPSLSSHLGTAIQALQHSGGQPLPTSVRTFMEPRFGRDFSGVRVHNTPQAAELSNQLNAKAFTVGNNIVLGKGTTSGQTTAEKHLIAHELTHVVQQSSTHATQLIQRAPVDSSTANAVSGSESGSTSGTQCNAPLNPTKVDHIVFNGNQLRVHHTDGTCAATQAQSGKYTVKSLEKAEQYIIDQAKAQGKDLQTKEEIDEHFRGMTFAERLEVMNLLEAASSEQLNGPIPDGSFEINPSVSNKVLDKSQSVGLSCGDVRPIKKGSQRVVRLENQACWGELRIKITRPGGGGTLDVNPKEKAGGKKQRFGFYVHGGASPDPVSSGCVKVLNDSFLQQLSKIPKAIPLVVKKEEASFVQVHKERIAREFLGFLSSGGLRDWKGKIYSMSGNVYDLTGLMQVENFDFDDDTADPAAATVKFSYSYRLKSGTLITGLGTGTVQGDGFVMKTAEKFGKEEVDGDADFYYIGEKMLFGEWKDEKNSQGIWDVTHP